jgi:polyhydroxybutyrate depolymerase
MTTLQVRDRTRTYALLTPEAPRPQAPLVLAFHGSNQNGAKMRAASGFDALAADAFVAYLDGYRGHWNDARKSAVFAARKENVDDVGFAEAVAEDVKSRHDIGPVYAADYSNGGQMVIRLIHQAPHLLAGAVVLSATQPLPDNFAVEGEPAALPVLLFHGTKDPLVPYWGGPASLWGFRARGDGMSAPDTAAYYARHNGITTKPTVTRTEGRLPVMRTDYRQAGQPPVTLFTVEGGGHVIPGRAGCRLSSAGPPASLWPPTRSPGSSISPMRPDPEAAGLPQFRGRCPRPGARAVPGRRRADAHGWGWTWC